MRLTGVYLLRNKLSLAGGVIAGAYLLLAMIVALLGERMLPYNPYAKLRANAPAA